MRTFFEYLKANHGSAVALATVDEHGDHKQRMVDVLDYNDVGITVGTRQHGQPTATAVEFYPWSAVVGVHTTFPKNTIFP